MLCLSYIYLLAKVNYSFHVEIFAGLFNLHFNCDVYVKNIDNS